jgi:hypothetical protein
MWLPIYRSGRELGIEVFASMIRLQDVVSKEFVIDELRLHLFHTDACCQFHLIVVK